MAEPTAPNPLVAKQPEEQIGLIQGQMPDSKNEWYVSLALDRLGLDYSYQYQLGIPGARGSQSVDFVVWSGGGGIPVEVQGSYWHNAANDPERAIKLNAEQARFHCAPIELTEEETSTREKALAAVKKKIL